MSNTDIRLWLECTVYCAFLPERPRLPWRSCPVQYGGAGDHRSNGSKRSMRRLNTSTEIFAIHAIKNIPVTMKPVTEAVIYNLHYIDPGFFIKINTGSIDANTINTSQGKVSMTQANSPSVKFLVDDEESTAYKSFLISLHFWVPVKIFANVTPVS